MKSRGIDVILTNKPWFFQTPCFIETGLLDFQIMTVSVLKMRFRKISLEVITDRDLNLVNEKFMSSLQSAVYGQNCEVNVENPDIFFRSLQWCA